MKEKVKYWFRWFSVFPGAILASVLALFPLHLILYTTLRGNTIFVEPYPELPERILTPLVVASIFVWIGSKIAPEHKTQTAIVLCGLWVFLSSGVIFLTLYGAGWMGRSLYFPAGGIAITTSIIGALVGLYLVKKDEQRKK